MKIKGALVREKGNPYEITTLELAEPKGKDILVKLVASGLCRSDYGERNGNSVEFPNVLGHEGAGIVEKVGESVTTIKPGDHVLISYAYCGDCKQCQEGHPSSCIHWLEYNNTGKNPRGEYILHTEEKQEVNSFFNQSSFATYSLTDESNVVKVDKEADLRLLGPLGCGLGTGSGAVLSVLKPDAGSTIAIFGTGAVGFAAVMAAKITGCSKIIAIDIVEKRLQTAKECGATHVINSKEVNPQDKIMEITNGAGVEYTIDTTGVPIVMKQALSSLSNGGTFVPLAVTKSNFEVNTFFELVFGNKKIEGVLIGNTIPKLYLPTLIDFYKKGQFPFDKFVKYYPFEDINQAEAESLTGEIIKPVVIIDKDYQPGK